MTQLQIVIPLWNEAKNIPALVAMLENSSLVKDETLHFILVNNGSTDDSKVLLEQHYHNKPWLKILNLTENQNYGGGILHGLKQTQAPFIGFIPGDLQVDITDVEKVWGAIDFSQKSHQVVYKGCRTIRKDGKSTQFVSKIYTKIANLILGIGVSDINGLPKIFHRDLLGLLSSEVMKTFVIDAQILATAHHHGWTIKEIPVTFHSRRMGVSSWSGKRIQVYIQSLKMLCLLRRKKLTLPCKHKQLQ